MLSIIIINTLVVLFDKSFLKFSVMKPKEMHSGREKAVSHPVKIKYHVVEMVPNFKYLGIALDSHLTFTGHVDHVRTETLCSFQKEVVITVLWFHWVNYEHFL